MKFFNLDLRPEKKAPLMKNLRIKKLGENAYVPTRGSDGAAGFDLYSPMDFELLSGARRLIPLEIAIALPRGTYGRIAGRSGLALLRGIFVGGGVVDSDYRGNLGVILINTGDQDVKFSKGDRIAQLLVEKIEVVEIVEEKGELGKTKRGDGGFGSSGK